MSAALLGYRWCNICHKTWSQWLLSVSPLNLSVEEQEGFKRGADELTFSFSSVSYLNKNPADLFSHISSLLTPSSPNALSNPTRTQLLKISFIARMRFRLYRFLSSRSQLRPGKGCTQNMTYHFPWGTKAVYQRTNFSASHCRVSAWRHLLWLFAVLRYSDKGCERRLMSHVRAQKQQETNYRSKQSPGGHYTHSPSFFKHFFFFIPHLLINSMG